VNFSKELAKLAEFTLEERINSKIFPDYKEFICLFIYLLLKNNHWIIHIMQSINEISRLNTKRLPLSFPPNRPGKKKTEWLDR
jgi:hypothetical protein